MRRRLTAVTVVLAVAVGVVGLAGATQSRPDRVSGEGNEILLSVRTRTGLDPDGAAPALWAACQHTVRHTRLVVLSPVGPAQYRLEVAPAVGELGRRRLVGCLEDATLDRVVADVLSVRPVVAVTPSVL